MERYVPSNRIRTAAWRRTRASLLACVALGLVVSGCPQEQTPSTVRDMGGGGDMGRLDMGMPPQDMGADQGVDMSGDMSVDMAVDMSPDMGPRRQMTLTLEADDAALWSAPRAQTSWTATLEETATAGVFEGAVRWPAGRVRPLLTLGEGDGAIALAPHSMTTTGLARVDDALLDSGAGDMQRARIFSPAPRDGVTVRVDMNGKTLSITLPDGDPGPSPWDAKQRGTSGVWRAFDEAIHALNTTDQIPFDVSMALINTLYAAGAGPVPQPDGETSLFVAPCPSGEPAPEIRGTFTSWDPDPATALVPITGELCGRFIRHGAGAQAYKVVYNNGAAWFTDPGNRHIEWDGINQNTVGDFNSILHGDDVMSARMVWWRNVESPQLGNARDVYVWMPPGYDDATNAAKRYPALYVHDGNESIVRSQLHEVMGQWASDESDPVLGIFVHLPTQNVRIAEYTMATMDARGDLYARFFEETLVPLVDARLRTRAERSARGVTGASLGGLISFHIASLYPQTFEYAAGMSSSFWWEERWMIERIKALGCQDLTYYLDSGNGGASQDGAPDTRLMRQALADMGCRHTHVEEDGATHDWFFWKGRFPEVLRVFRAVHSPAP